jgi:bacteriocin-like protein
MNDVITGPPKGVIDVTTLEFDEYGRYVSLELSADELQAISGGVDWICPNVACGGGATNFYCPAPPPSTPQNGEDTDGM